MVVNDYQCKFEIWDTAGAKYACLSCRSRCRTSSFNLPSGLHNAHSQPPCVCFLTSSFPQARSATIHLLPCTTGMFCHAMLSLATSVVLISQILPLRYVHLLDHSAYSELNQEDVLPTPEPGTLPDWGDTQAWNTHSHNQMQRDAV